MSKRKAATPVAFDEDLPQEYLFYFPMNGTYTSIGLQHRSWPVPCNPGKRYSCGWGAALSARASSNAVSRMNVHVLDSRPTLFNHSPDVVKCDSLLHALMLFLYYKFIFVRNLFSGRNQRSHGEAKFSY